MAEESKHPARRLSRGVIVAAPTTPMTDESSSEPAPAAPRRRARVGLRDVARAAGVSIATASHALNGKGRVDPRTREDVLATAERLGYRANRAARHLRRGSTGVIAFAHDVPVTSPAQLASIEYFVKILTSAAGAASRHGYALVIPPIEAGSLDDLNVDGAIVMDPESNSPLMAMLEQRDVPVVTAGRDATRPRDEGWWVDNDIEGETVGALDHLAARGARSVALVTTRPSRSYTYDSISGYERWCRARGQEPRIVLLDGLASETHAYEATQPLLTAPDPPDAIYAPLDRLAVGAQLAVHNAGLRVPHDVMIAAGSDSESTRSARPQVTALSLHPDKIGQVAVDLLVARLRGETTTPQQVVIEAEIAERESTARGG